MLVACLECDLLHRKLQLPAGRAARCTRCGALLYRNSHPAANERTLALALAACIAFVLANAFPILGLEAQGARSSTTLLDAVRALWEDQARAVATLVLITTVIVPALELITLVGVLLALRQRWRSAAAMLHFIETVKPWGMVEVFVLGTLVSLVKLAHVATVEPGVALYSFGALMLLIAAAAATFDADAAWTQVASGA